MSCRFNWRILLLLLAVSTSMINAGDLIVKNGAEVVVKNAISMNGGDVILEPGSVMNLQGGVVLGVGDFYLQAGSSFSATGMVTIVDTWVNNSGFIRSLGFFNLLIPISTVTNRALGMGDTDGDGYSDRGEGSFDHQTNGIPDFLEGGPPYAMSTPPHDWLEANGLPTDGSADFVDSDGDGLNNWEEYHALTNPKDSNSLLRVTQSTPINAGPQFALEWDSVEGKTYELTAGTDLIDGSDFPTALTQRQATASSTTVTSPASASSFRYYRINAVP